MQNLPSLDFQNLTTIWRKLNRLINIYFHSRVCFLSSYLTKKNLFTFKINIVTN